MFPKKGYMCVRTPIAFFLSWKEHICEGWNLSICLRQCGHVLRKQSLGPNNHMIIVHWRPRPPASGPRVRANELLSYCASQNDDS